ncbi:MAG: hypothetical protein ACI4MJ_06730 [Aristaeellaceae bacterium]
MRRLAAGIAALLLFTQPVLADAAASYPAGETYVVGVDMQEGLYSFFSLDDTSGIMTVTDWDGSIVHQQEVEPGWYETMRVYNEQTVTLPAGCQGEFHLGFATSVYDTGTRGLRVAAPGSYRAGADVLPGLYIVGNTGSENADVAVMDSEGATVHQWSLQPGAEYTLLLREGWAVAMGADCLLRSMTRGSQFQTGTVASVQQGRYAAGMQLPTRNYTVTGRSQDALVQVTMMDSGESWQQTLLEGESCMLALQGQTNVLVELVDVDVTWEDAEG